MRQKTVFIVEDDPDIRDVIFLVLSGHKYEVRMLSSATELKEEMNAQLPDLIVLDVRLPDGNGLDICKQLKQDRLTERIPVILMSANNYQAATVQSADAYIGKPFDIAVFKDAVEKLLFI